MLLVSHSDLTLASTALPSYNIIKIMHESTSCRCAALSLLDSKLQLIWTWGTSLALKYVVLLLQHVGGGACLCEVAPSAWHLVVLVEQPHTGKQHHQHAGNGSSL